MRAGYPIPEVQGVLDGLFSVHTVHMHESSAQQQQEEEEGLTTAESAAVCICMHSPLSPLLPHPHTDAKKEGKDPNKVVVAQIAPAVRVAIAETMGLAPGEVTVGQLVTGLRQLGFDYVFGKS